MLYRTILLMTGAGALTVGIILAFMLAMSWSSVARIEPVAAHLDYYLSLQEVRTGLRARLIGAEADGSEGHSARVRLNGGTLEPVGGAKTVGPLSLEGAAEALERLAGSQAALVGDSHARLIQASQALRHAAGDEASQDAAAEVLGRVSEALRVEAAAYRGLLEELDDQSRRGLHAALALAVVLPAFGLAFATLFHRRVLVPLNDLTYLMGLLARKDYVAAAMEDIDPLMRPLFEKYNRMVKRMHDVEQGHLKREDSLQRDVDQATRALVQQQLALSRVERLAAVGEISARLVHELRNPLSGVLMALTNLRGEIQSEDQDERLKLAIAELERIAHLLSNVVEDVRQIPERPRWLRLSDVVGDLLTLVRYQLDEDIELIAAVPPDLRCRLPESGLRHALLNLVLNASQAMGERPGTIRIAARREDEVLVITVSDDGPGFPEALLAAGVHDFGAWRRGGTGLGLATVRRFVLAHAGRLRLDNRVEGGAQVTLHLPLEENDG